MYLNCRTILTFPQKLIFYRVQILESKGLKPIKLGPKEVTFYFSRYVFVIIIMKSDIDTSGCDDAW